MVLCFLDEPSHLLVPSEEPITLYFGFICLISSPSFISASSRVSASFWAFVVADAGFCEGGCRPAIFSRTMMFKSFNTCPSLLRYILFNPLAPLSVQPHLHFGPHARGGANIPTSAPSPSILRPPRARGCDEKTLHDERIVLSAPTRAWVRRQAANFGRVIPRFSYARGEALFTLDRLSTVLSSPPRA